MIADKDPSGLVGFYATQAEFLEAADAALEGERVAEEVERDGVDARRHDECRDLLDSIGMWDSEPCPDGPWVHHPGERCPGCGRLS